MSNSPLVDYTRISPNKNSPRKHKIDTITIHSVVGQCTVESLGSVFAPATRRGSSNYGVGYDGRIGLYVDEKDRSWCSSSSANDHRAITIEVASDTKPPYAITDAAYNGLIKLLVDICKRNDIKELKWKADKSLIGQVDKQNMTIHKWFADTSCPGEYLYNLHGKIAADVNAQLGVINSEETKENNAQQNLKPLDIIAKEVINGKWGNGTERKNRLTKAGYDYSEVQKRVNELVSNKKPNLKPLDVIAKEVINGIWGNGTERKNRLTEAGYDYSEVQKRVNELCASKSTKQPIDIIAKEVINGKWGNGTERKNRLTKAGYDYSEVQKRVNELL